MWCSASWLAHWQSKAACRIAALADSLWTNADIHAEWLPAVIGNAKPTRVHRCSPTSGGYTSDPSASIGKLSFKFDWHSRQAYGATDAAGIAMLPDGSFWGVDTGSGRILHSTTSGTTSSKWRIGPRAIPLRSTRTTHRHRHGPELGLPGAHGAVGLPTSCLMYENGDLGYAFIPVSGSTETFYRRALQSFDASSNPIWAAPAAVAAVDASLIATNLATPFYHGTNSALIRSRFPIIPGPTGSEVIFFDQTVGNLCPPSYASNNCNNSYHLGAVPQCGAGFGWRRSPTGAIDFSQPTGTFQTAAIDGTVNYGGTSVWALGTNIFYGYRGKGSRRSRFTTNPTAA